jgi:hypothetical protein
LESNYSFFSPIFVLIFQLFGSWLLQPKIAAVTVVKEEEKKAKAATAAAVQQKRTA